MILEEVVEILMEDTELSAHTYIKLRLLLAKHRENQEEMDRFQQEQMHGPAGQD